MTLGPWASVDEWGRAGGADAHNDGADSDCVIINSATRSVDELACERTSPSAKSAVKSLLEAPSATGHAKKTKKGKANA